ncbi:54S ribosomal protein L25, mitochondrial [Wickerhamomyces ciferrii]|uniref:54S ribosomal protein L25, mitochondrial n=1 Tax=Wickerhamomyces ciferrii (strain ATCC 14091 / BCRC 22168 / CBS 111 / JCM 3599 / NBRC 0793 / NRRL Y-1031 F-60-10) TaxID=1206466 RepID=K0KMM5_WICCF|nr:54S ribosomal protein L25, mitochondrial [Wickerhamomyces ciferrii]CCH43457.1 54S ribosomal protein L25, mitochondrial [Wickerhamomyces ciferrii]
MRPSVGLFHTAKNVITQTIDQSNPASYFDTLPGKLKRFFERYPPRPFKEYASKSTLTNAPDANPFIANKHPVTQRYHTSKYSMRRQSDLWKLAYRFGIQDYLPPLQNGKKFYQEKYDSRPIMKGVLRPKGHKYERTAAERIAAREEAISKIDDVIAQHKSKRVLRDRAAKKEKRAKHWV